MDGKRKLDTDDIVAKAMEEEEGRKRLKKTGAPAQGIVEILMFAVQSSQSAGRWCY